ncbi:MAG TPA: HEAT repeat domain-containing protein [Candidatus Polarisedimenticolia bacterium]|nr:HEAT repeat domain-containing protein [Candidatus Polarisedimenticolia bacterium]
MSQRSPEPRYRHLLEVLDGAASLGMAIRHAETVLTHPDLGEEDRQTLESVLAASRLRMAHLRVVLESGGTGAVELTTGEPPEDAREWTERELLEAGRQIGEDSEDTEHETAKAIERLGRSQKMSARGTIESFLAHPSPLLRAASLKVLALHWRLRDYTERVLWTLTADTDPDCRRAAALCLGSLYEGTRDKEIGKELVAALTREGEEEDVRWASYYALLDVEGTQEATRPLPVDGFHWPTDADQELIARYAGSR